MTAPNTQSKTVFMGLSAKGDVAMFVPRTAVDEIHTDPSLLRAHFKEVSTRHGNAMTPIMLESRIEQLRTRGFDDKHPDMVELLKGQKMLADRAAFDGAKSKVNVSWGQPARA